MKEAFNDTLITMRAIPVAPSDLAERIIAQAMAQRQNSDQFIMWLMIPRPYLLMSILFCLSIFAGMGFDMGFNTPDSLYISEGDMLLSFDEGSL